MRELELEVLPRLAATLRPVRTERAANEKCWWVGVAGRRVSAGRNPGGAGWQEQQGGGLRCIMWRGMRCCEGIDEINATAASRQVCGEVGSSRADPTSSCCPARFGRLPPAITIYAIHYDFMHSLAFSPQPQDELASAGLLFSQQQQTAGLAPKTGSAFDAAAAAGPHAASVLGGPLLAGEYQPHSHHAGAAPHGAAAAVGAAGALAGVPGAATLQGGTGPAFVQPLGSQAAGSGRLPVALPDKTVTPSQQVLMGEEQ